MPFFSKPTRSAQLIVLIKINDNSTGILAAEVLYNPAFFTTKLSILLFKPHFSWPKFKVILWLVGTFVSFTAAAVNIFQCVSVEAVWTPAIRPYASTLR